MINIIGIGPGDIGFLTKEGEEIINVSDVLIGGTRNLEIFSDFKGEKIEIKGSLRDIIDYINENKHKNISIIASGDPSIYGIGKYMVSELGKENINIVSGISSIQYLFSKIKMDMNDIYISSCHGKEPDFDYILSHKKVSLVTDKKIGPKEIAKEIIKRNLKKVMVIGENLSYENEKITIGTPEDILKISKFDMNVVVIYDEG
ncbi:cobalt-precorrin-7 (C(5))-methyltransferase [Tepidibacter formicigenes]|jgi:cobalt-precorrin-7 (C5)-methyltransferase|uniref:Precorrin-6Y C5,15-methyltransferase (Decarboxylating) n=1 Tax=Tepidibacter formicigenes DSM 15518 TaxID=1123349 RepID=A0A1M6RHL6_9FIRM|nr:cobalt-precorrin-7 (C(5))-methyltransferase [Tepidibacter formicigenes]SHK31929.1 precorrin-6Y C5,15-methyltransferase (decarboxylating) [Tepidibacter formicigenes DSM 15518]